MKPSAKYAAAFYAKSDKHGKLMNNDGHDGWAYCGCELAAEIRAMVSVNRRAEPVKRIVMGEGYPHSYEGIFHLYEERGLEGACTLIMGDNLDPDVRIRVVVEVIE